MHVTDVSFGLMAWQAYGTKKGHESSTYLIPVLQLQCFIKAVAVVLLDLSSNAMLVTTPRFSVL